MVSTGSSPGRSPTLVTVGHGTNSVEGLLRLLGAAEVVSLVDIRIAPGSRRWPHFSRDAMANWLGEAGISYRWEQRLGGFRKLPEDSPDVAIRNESFRAYASHMRTADFVSAIGSLLTEAEDAVTAVMCSESVWWRCHRRLVADYVSLIAGWQVAHLMPDGRLRPHAPTDGVRVSGDQLIYDGLLGS